MIKYFLPLILLICYGYSQQSYWDSLNIQYRLLQTNYENDQDIIKIKVPPFLSTWEVMDQIKLATQWPGDPPPKKQTKVYVFKDDAIVGDYSKTGGVYIPGKGFKWDLRDWQPDTTIRLYTPRLIDKIIYNALLDSMFVEGMYSLDFETEENTSKKKVAKEFEISVSQLDSIYYRVKWWLDLNKHAEKAP